MNDDSTILISPEANLDLSVEVPTVRARDANVTLPMNESDASERFATQIGKFRVVRLLGRGGQASAYEAFDPDLQRSVVLKVYESAETVEEQEAVLREGQALARVHSPYVAQCHGADRHGHAPYLIVEHVAGETLSERIRRGQPSLEQSLEWMSRLAEGVAAIHARELLHRDLKSSNILIDGDGRPRIIDFGLATAAGKLESQVISGTPAYMAPEVARGETQRIDARADIFGLGAVFYELLTGRPPFAGQELVETWKLARAGQVRPLQEIRPDLPPAIAALVMSCLANSIDQRLASASYLATTLSQRLTELRQPAAKGLNWTLRLGKFRIRLALGVSLASLLLIASIWEIDRRLGPVERDVAFGPTASEPFGLATGAMNGTPDSGPGMAAMQTAHDLRDLPEAASQATVAGAEDAKSKRDFDVRGATRKEKLLRYGANAPSPDSQHMPLAVDKLGEESFFRVRPTTGGLMDDDAWQVAANDRFQLEFTTKQACQAAVYLERADGTVTQLVPNGQGDAGVVVAGQTLTWPGSREAQEAANSPWIVRGNSLLHIVVREPDWKPALEWDDQSYAEFSTPQRLELWRNEIRPIETRATEARATGTRANGYFRMPIITEKP